LAHIQPTTLEMLRSVRGLGERKIADFGARFLERIAVHKDDLQSAIKPNVSIDNTSG
jgi:HRDC domain